jgi:hypothetical protein
MITTGVAVRTLVVHQMTVVVDKEVAVTIITTIAITIITDQVLHTVLHNLEEAVQAEALLLAAAQAAPAVEGQEAGKHL